LGQKCRAIVSLQDLGKIGKKKVVKSKQKVTKSAQKLTKINQS